MRDPEVCSPSVGLGGPAVVGALSQAVGEGGVVGPGSPRVARLKPHLPTARSLQKAGLVGYRVLTEGALFRHVLGSWAPGLRQRAFRPKHRCVPENGKSE